MKVQKKEGPILYMEEYAEFFRGRNSLDFTIIQLNQIIHMHGFSKVRRNKIDVMEALGHLELMNPSRSTLAQSGGTDGVSYFAPLPLDQVKSDFDEIGWEECPVGSLVSSVTVEEQEATANAKALVCSATSSSTTSAAAKKRKSRAAGGGASEGKRKGNGKPPGRPPRRPLLFGDKVFLLTNE